MIFNRKNTIFLFVQFELYGCIIGCLCVCDVSLLSCLEMEVRGQTAAGHCSTGTEAHLWGMYEAV